MTAGWRPFAACGIDPDFYNYRAMALEETAPWDHMDVGVSRAFLAREYQKALRAETTPPLQPPVQRLRRQ